MIKFILLSVFSLLVTMGAIAAPADSLRLEYINGNPAVVHRADKGQTLYSLLRKYGSSMSEFKQMNPGVDIDLQLGKVYKIPYGKQIVQKAKVQAPTTVANNTSAKAENTYSAEPKPVDAVTFKVLPGMTLFAVSKRTGTSVKRIKELNNLKSDTITPGQILVVKEGSKAKMATPSKELAQTSPKEEPATPSYKPTEKQVIVVNKPEPVVAATAKEPIKTQPKPAVIDQPVAIAKPAEITEEKPKIIEPSTVIEEKVAENTGSKMEEGVAELIEVESKSGKFLALHKSAPVGTLVLVKNETTGARVWVKVIGRLPELEQNQNIVIKLSPQAMKRVSPVDKRFRAKLEYSI